MESEGPYQLMRGGRIGGPWEWIKGPTEPQRWLEPKGEVVIALNAAHAEGRKAAEKDFQELLELAEALHGDIDFISTSTQDFAAWKKARGII
jgi:hypothetical protein